MDWLSHTIYLKCPCRASHSWTRFSFCYPARFEDLSFSLLNASILFATCPVILSFTSHLLWSYKQYLHFLLLGPLFLFDLAVSQLRVFLLKTIIGWYRIQFQLSYVLNWDINVLVFGPPILSCIILREPNIYLI